jgi:energy-coupling factor transporter ATP-binding protein EcfA2
MSLRPVRSWGYPGALVDALRDTRTVVAAVEFPFESAVKDKALVLVNDILEQLDQHLIPRALEQSSPAIVVVGGSTGAGKSTIVNAILGADLTKAGVLRPTTMAPHLFHNPNDSDFLSSAMRRATVHPHAAIPRGIALVDSPDIDSLVSDNREVARHLLDAADLWIFVTTAARYGDALPWDALRLGAERGASIAIVLNRVTADVAAHVRRDLVERLRREGLESLPLFVIPEQPQGLRSLPPDVIDGLKKWLDSVAATSANTIIERTLSGAFEALKEWLERLAELMDERATVVKEARGAVRRAAAQAEQEGGEFWFRDIAVGPVATLWTRAAGSGGPLFKIRSTSWAKRSGARASRDAALGAIRAELLGAVEASLAFAVNQAFERMVTAIGLSDEGPGAWLLSQRDPAQVTAARHVLVREAAEGWLALCGSLIGATPTAAYGKEIVGDEGLGTTFASAVLGIGPARQALALLAGSGMQDIVDQARTHLTHARRSLINREALAMISPSDLPGLAPDESAVIRLRRAELRGLL